MKPKLFLLMMCLLVDVYKCQKKSVIFDPGSIHDSQKQEKKLYTYDEIVSEMERTTDEFYREYIDLRNMLPEDSQIFYRKNNDDFDDDSLVLDPARRRRRRSIQDTHVPEFIRDGIQLIHQIVPMEEEDGGEKQRLCSGNGNVMDFFFIKFHMEQYVLCLVQDSVLRKSKLYHGPIGKPELHRSYDLENFSNPRKIFGFIAEAKNEINDTLIAVLVNDRRLPHEPNVLWIQINTRNEIIYQNQLATLKRIEPDNVAQWPRYHTIIVHDLFDSSLKIYRFTRTYFDHVEFTFPVSMDLNAICAFTLSGVSYLVLGYRQDDPIRAKDVKILRYNYHFEKLKSIQNIQCDSSVLQIEYFSIGYGINQEDFLAVVETNHIVLYKFLKPKREFLIFQRIRQDSVRKIRTYGNSKRQFVMAVILNSNDIYFITYNSLRFIYSRVTIRLYANPIQPIDLQRIFGFDSVQLMIGSTNGLRMYDIRFFHDQNLFKLWTEHLKWCHQKRLEISELEKRRTIIQKRFKESYFKTDPLIIHGTLTVPSYQRQSSNSLIEVKNYRHADTSSEINEEFFNRLNILKNNLDNIETDIRHGHKRLNQAVYINTDKIQEIFGNFTFNQNQIFGYNGNNNEENFPITVNIITEYLNGKFIGRLFTEVINIFDNENISRILNHLRFSDIDLNNLFIHGLVNDRFNMSNVVMSGDGLSYEIFGKKRFHQSLMIEDSIYSNYVNGKRFEQENVLLTDGDQLIRNPIRTVEKQIRTSTMNILNLNNFNFNDYLNSMIQLDQPIPLDLSVEFSEKLMVDHMTLDGRLNGLNLQDVYDGAIWLDSKHGNQTIRGRCLFSSNVSINGELFAEQINNRRLPNEFVRSDGIIRNTITGRKIFQNKIHVRNLNITHQINGLAIINDIPDIVISDVEQNITGRKTILNDISVENGSGIITGRINGLSLTELDKRRQERPETRYFDQITIDDMAQFSGGLWFDQINSVTDGQFRQLVQDALAVDDPVWNHPSVSFDQVHFDELEVNNLECNTINGIDLSEHLWTRNRAQTIPAMVTFEDILLQQSRKTTKNQIEFLNQISMRTLDNLMRKDGIQQRVNGTKRISGDLYVSGPMKAKIINDISFSDVVFKNEGDEENSSITGHKRFRQARFDRITVMGELEAKSINQISLDRMMVNALRRNEQQTISNQMRFNTLNIFSGEEFNCPSLNGQSLQMLAEDVVYANGQERQNVTGKKNFYGPVRFDAPIEYEHLFDGITVYEMKHNWLVNGNDDGQQIERNLDGISWWSNPSSSNNIVRGNFSIDQLVVINRVQIHDSNLNQINLDRLINDHVIWLDNRTAIRSEIDFFGNVKINGNILLNGKLNEIDPRKDVVVTAMDQMDNRDVRPLAQTIRGNIRLVNDVKIKNDLDVNGLVNGIDVQYLCSRVYRTPSGDDSQEKRQLEPLVILGNVTFIAPVRFEKINDVPFDQLDREAIRHDGQQNQIVRGKKKIETLILNGPTVLNRYLNDLDLDDIFENYLSVSKDQEVSSKIIFRGVHFDDDVQIRSMISDTDIVNGINIAELDRYSLRLNGEQIYTGNIFFDTDVDIDLWLNVRKINGIDPTYFMQKRRTVNTFTEEITFTQSLNVRNSMNVVEGRKISDVHLDRILKDTVRQQSDRNYTVYGEKIFEKLDVYLLHTRPLNNVTFSRENLLLKNFDQIIYGHLNFTGNLHVNRTLSVRSINGIDIQDLRRRLVKKNEPKNIVRTKIRIPRLEVNSANVQSYIDNVNLSVLNQFSNTSRFLRDVQIHLGRTRAELNLLHRNLHLIGSRLLYYDDFALIKANDLFVDDVRSSRKISSPLIFTMVNHDTLCMFLPVIGIGSNFSPENCNNQIEIYCQNNGRFQKRFTFQYPGRILTMKEANEHVWFLATDVSMSECLWPGNSLHNDTTVAVQIIRYFPQTGQFMMNFVQTSTIIDVVTRNLIFNFDTNPSFGTLLSIDNYLNILHIGNITHTEIFLVPEARFRLSGTVKTIHQWKNLIAVSSYRKDFPEIEIFIWKRLSGTLELFQTIPGVWARRMITVENQNPDIPWRTFLFLASDSNFIHVFATTDGTGYTKMQEIVLDDPGAIQEIISMPEYPPGSKIVLIRQPSHISLYRFAGNDGFRRWYRIESIDPNIDSVLVSNGYLAFYRNGDCTTDQESYIEILKPIYRMNAIASFESRYHGRSQNETVQIPIAG